jgi:hypothetical protein
MDLNRKAKMQERSKVIFIEWIGNLFRTNRLKPK